MATQLTILVIQKFCILHHKLLATTKAFINASLARWCSDSIWCPVWCDAKFFRNVCSPMANYRGIEIKVSSKYSSCRLEFSRSSAFCNNRKKNVILFQCARFSFAWIIHSHVEFVWQVTHKFHTKFMFTFHFLDTWRTFPFV